MIEDDKLKRRIMDTTWVFSIGMILYILLFTASVKNFNDEQLKKQTLVKNFETINAHYICSNGNFKFSNEYLVSKSLGWEIYNDKYFINMNESQLGMLMRVENCKLNKDRLKRIETLNEYLIKYKDNMR